jgi:AraC-like DNA-binding protein
MNIGSQNVEKLYDLTQVVQSVFVDGELIISTLHGMYFVYEGKLNELIPRIEFNKYGLLAYQDFIFAGSIEGLYVIDKGILLNDIAKSLKSEEFKNNKELFYRWGIAFLCLVILIAISIIYYYIKKRKNELVQPIKSSIINPDSIRQVVLENPTLVSVESIADYFETSTVQLNRILKKYNTSGLAVLKSIKQDIVKEMMSQQKSMEEISKRVGYSIGYIKRNLL